MSTTTILFGETGRKFPYKFHDLITTVERQGGMDHIISWKDPHGRCFKIHDPDEFIKRIVPAYYERDKSKKQPKFESIVRNLNLWGFTRLRTGMDKGWFYHEFFVRDHRSLCQYISRRAVNGKVRQKKSDIDEPNFYVDNRYQYCYFNNGTTSNEDLNEKDDEGRNFIHLPQLQLRGGQRYQKADIRSTSSLLPPNEKTLSFWGEDARNGTSDSFWNSPFQKNQSDLHASTQLAAVEQKGKVAPTFPFSFTNEGRDDNEDSAFEQEEGDGRMLCEESHQIGTGLSTATGSKLSDPNIVSIDSSDNIDCFGPEEVKTLFNVLF